MTTKNAVDGFLSHRQIAVVGVSRNGRGFGYAAWRTLRQKGWEAVPVNPAASAVDGIPCYPTLRDLPGGTIEAAVVVTPSAVTEKVVEDAAAAGIRWLWLQQGASSEKALAACREHKIEAISNECILMHANPGGPHKVHRWVWKIIGKLPQ
jgi:predicted CoA-binding protein